ncbi:MAG: hypothetical protein KGI80_01960 [Verrucomicrobiota bacterium]|nr:hypothetical protein [Verrucomicrobiota bacterium]
MNSINQVLSQAYSAANQGLSQAYSSAAWVCRSLPTHYSALTSKVATIARAVLHEAKTALHCSRCAMKTPSFQAATALGAVGITALAIYSFYPRAKETKEDKSATVA